MTIRVPLPGDNWADLKSADELTGADQDVVFDSYDVLMELKPQPEPQPDPDNPAVMKEAPPRRLTNADGRALRDAVLGVVITAWSYDHLPLPFVAGYRAQLPVKACNALATAAGPMQAALFGNDEDEDEDPKKNGQSPGSGGSSASSPESTASLLPAPPAVPSGTP